MTTPTRAVPPLHSAAGGTTRAPRRQPSTLRPLATVATSAIATLLLTTGAFGSPTDPVFGGLPTIDTTAPKGQSFQDGDSGVDEERGAAIYSFPIKVPPGRNGMAPSLSFSYSSQAPLRGGIAAGWTGPSLPTVEVDSTARGNEVKYRVNHNARLIKVDDILAGATEVYRAEFDASFTRWELWNQVDVFSTIWIARSLDGSHLEFRRPPTPTPLQQWVLTAQVDAYGNRIDYNWEPVNLNPPNLPATGITYRSYELISIDYTANPNAGLQAHAQIRFNYDRLVHYQDGSRIPVGSQLTWVDGVRTADADRADGVVTAPLELRSVTTFVRATPSAQWTLVGSTNFTYEYSDAARGAQLRYLTAIDAAGYRPGCVVGTTCEPLATRAPTTTFTYGDDPEHAYDRTFDGSHTINFPASSIPPHATGYGGERSGATSGFLDMDSNGKRDYVTIAAVPDPTHGGKAMCTLAVYPGNGDGTFGSPYSVRLPTLDWANGISPGQLPGTSPFNTGRIQERCTLGGQHVLLNATIDRPGAMPDCHGPYYAILGYHFMDYEGDGHLDVVTSYWRSAAFRDRSILSSFKITPAAPRCEGGHLDSHGVCNCPPGREYNGAACDMGTFGLPDNFVDPRPPEPPSPGIPGTINDHSCDEYHSLEPDRDDATGKYLLQEYTFWGNSSFQLYHDIRSPVPLPPGNEEGRIQVMQGNSPVTLQTMMDIDGNGYLDFITTPPSQLDPLDHADLGYSTSLRVGSGGGNADFVRNDFRKPSFSIEASGGISPSWPNATAPTSADVRIHAELRDMNGDGTPDLVVRHGATHYLTYYPNTGKRFATPGIDSGYNIPVENKHYDIYSWDPSSDAAHRIPLLGSIPLEAVRTDTTMLLDVDADGRADIIDIQGSTQNPQPKVRYNLGDGFSALYSLPTAWLAARHMVQSYSDKSWTQLSEVADVDADGLPDLVAWSATDPRSMTWSTNTVHSAPPRYLHTVSNGRRMTVEYEYRPASALGIAVPSPLWVVSKVTTTPDTATGQGVMSTTYTYGPAQFGQQVSRSLDDFRSLGFQGFQSVAVTNSAPAGALQGATTRRYYSYGTDGRGYLTATYAYDGLGTIQTVASQTWEQADLFGKIRITRPKQSGLHVCTVQQQHAATPEAACGDSPRNAVTTTSFYEPHLVNSQVAFFLTSGSVQTRADDPGVNRATNSTYRISYSAGTSTTAVYRVQQATSRTSRWAGQFTIPTTTSRQETVYDSNGFPIRTLDWFGPGDGDFVTTVRTFDNATGNLRTIKKPNQAAQTSAAPGQDKVTTLDYEAYKLFVTVRTNELHQFTITTTDLGTGAVTRVQGPQGSIIPGACGSSLCLNEEDWQIDGFGRQVQHSGTYFFGPSNSTSMAIVPLSTTSFDDVNNLVTERHVIDPTESPTPRQTTTISRTDGLGRMLSQETCRGVTASCPDAANDPITSYSYDSAGLLSTMTMPSPAADTATVTYSFRHDSLGRLTRLLRPDGSAVDIQYTVATTDTAASSPAGSTDYGFRYQLTSDSGSGTTSRYDLMGRLVAVQECSTAVCAVMPSGINATGWEPTTYTYDDFDRIVEIVDAEGNPTEMEHDLLGRRVKITRGIRQWKYEYDYDGNMTAEISPMPAGTSVDTPYRSTTRYDALDRPTEHYPATRGMTDSQLSSLWIGSTYFRYDESTTGAGRLTHVEQPRPSQGPYSGRPILTVAYTYDGIGRVRQETRTSNATGGASDDITQSVTRAYNAMGSATLSTWDDGQSVATTYDLRGSTQSVAYVTGAGASARVVADYGIRSRAGLPSTRNTGAEFGGQQALWTYDQFGRVLTNTVRASASSLLASRSYQYDELGELRSLSGTTQPTGGDGSGPGRSLGLGYTYDRTHRLISASDTTTTTGYAIQLGYSATGNISTASIRGVFPQPGGPNPNRNVVYRYDGFDPQAVVRLEDNTPQHRLVATMTYDEAGDMTARSWPLGQELQMTWDGESQLREARSPDGSIERYHYDHTGQRVWARKDTGADAGTRYWFGESELFVPVAATAPRKRNLYVSDGGASLARSERVGAGQPAVELTYSDSLQNLMLTTSTATPTTSPNGVRVTSWFHYGAFGEVIAQGGEQTHRREFNAKESDAATGLRYYGARYYDPLLMRWNSADPLYRFAPDANLQVPQRQNLYTFTANNPLAMIDPDGRDVDDEWAHAAWATGAPMPGGFSEGEYQYHLAMNTPMTDSMPKTAKKLEKGATIAAVGLMALTAGGAIAIGVRGAVAAIAYVGVKDLAVIGGVGVGGYLYFSSGGGGESVSWTNHGNKHVVDSAVPWKEVVKSTADGGAKYLPGTNVEALERSVWESGKAVTNGKNWKVAEFSHTIGASDGKEVRWMRVECSGRTIHGHPITQDEYRKLTKKKDDK